MRIIDLDRKQSIKNVSIYLTPEEAQWMKKELDALLMDPEAIKHFHVHSLDNSGREISCSIITKEKLKHLDRYNKLEQTVLSEK